MRKINVFASLVVTFASAIGVSARRDEFKITYKDESNGLNWSQYVGEHTNGCANQSGSFSADLCTYETKLNDAGEKEFVLDLKGNKKVNPDTSTAARVCKEIGGRLPTMEDTESLLRQFQDIPREESCVQDETQKCVYLNDKEISKMRAVFNDEGSIFFWLSSSPDYDDPTLSFLFYGGVGAIGIDDRSKPRNTRCVRD